MYEQGKLESRLWALIFERVELGRPEHADLIQECAEIEEDIRTIFDQVFYRTSRPRLEQKLERLMEELGEEFDPITYEACIAILAES